MKQSRLRALRGPVIAVLALAASLALAVGSSGATTSHHATTKSKVSLTVGFISTSGVFTGPEGFAYSKGLLQKWLAPSGITIAKTASFDNGPLLTAALLGGSVDLGTIGDTPALIAKSAGAPTRIINQTQLNLQSVIIAQPSIKTLAGLAGKDITRQDASFMDRYLQGLLQEKGLLSKVTLVAGLLPTAIPAFNAGSIDALVLQPSQLPLIKTKYNVLASSQTSPNLTGTSVTEVTDKALAADPGLPAAWNAARAKAIAYAKANASAYYAFQGKAEGTTAALAAKYFPLADNPAQPFTATGLAHLTSTLKFLVSDKLAKSFSISSWQVQ
jgi:sulfonate transport system substrate-binding protein